MPDSTAGGTVEGNAANGVLVLRGRLYEDQDAEALMPTEAGDFIVRKAEGDPVAVARIDAEGNLYLAGRVHHYPWAVSGNSAFPNPASPPGYPDVTACFTLKTPAPAGVPFAFFTSEGHLYLRGGLFETDRPDPGYAEETLVWSEEFEGTDPLSERGWTVNGDWTKDRFKEFSVCLTAAGVEPCASGCEGEGEGETASCTHTHVGIGHVFIDTEPPSGCEGEGEGEAPYCAEVIVGRRTGGDTLQWAHLHRMDPDCGTPVALEAVDNYTGYHGVVSVTDEELLALITEETPWYVEALTNGGNLLMGGYANASRPSGVAMNYPNHFLTLNDQGTPGSDYADRSMDLDGNDGFIVNVHYQIAEDGTDPDPEDNPGVVLEVFNDGASYPLIRATVNHYEVESEQEGEGQQEGEGEEPLKDRTRLLLEVDLDSDGTPESSDEADYERSEPGGPPNWNPPVYGMFAPILRETAWYHIVVFVQRDLTEEDSKFQVRAITMMEGIQVVPADITLATGSQNRLEPAKLRLSPCNTYQDITHFRLDDISVVKVAAWN